MELSSQIDQYCERTDFSFWAEPFNFFSNFAFLWVAFIAYQKARSLGLHKNRTVKTLIALLVSVGMGSALFHSLATRWAQIADVASIGLFVLVFLWCWLRQVLSIKLLASLSWFVTLIILTVLSSVFLKNPAWNGSEGYFGLQIFIVGLGWHHWRIRAARADLFLAGLVFGGALVMRTLDFQVCMAFPWGTHMLWHTGNAIVCYLVMKTLLTEFEANLIRGKSRQS